MADKPDRRMIPRRSQQSAEMVASVKRALAITPRLNRLTFDEPDEIRALFSELIGRPLDAGFSLIPPFYTTGGQNIRLGTRVFINQNCTMYDLGGIDIGDDVLIGPNVSLITSGHPLDPAQRQDFVTASPIVIGAGVWLAAGVTVIGGVTIGANAVVAAGSVVTRDVPPGVLVAGNPARVIRPLTAGDDPASDPSAAPISR